MEGDRDPACLSPFTALWTWTRNGYHMADEGERRGEPCVNPAEFMGDKEEVEKRSLFFLGGRVCRSALLGRLHSYILFNSVQTQSASLIYSDGVKAFLFIPLLPNLSPSLRSFFPSHDCRGRSRHHGRGIIRTFMFMYLIINL